jgi:hypothetical protein
MQLLFLLISVLTHVCPLDFIVQIAFHVGVFQSNSHNDYPLSGTFVIYSLWYCHLSFHQGQQVVTPIRVIFTPPFLQELVPWEEERLAELGDTVGIVGFLSRPMLLHLDLFLCLSLHCLCLW